MRRVLQVNLNVVQENIKQFKQQFSRFKCLFPVKCFPYENALSIFAQEGFGFDVSNQTEYQKVAHFIKENTVISASSPNSQTLKSTKANHFVFADSVEEFLQGGFDGVRVNFNGKNFIKSHFGISLDELKDIAPLVGAIHFHISDTKNKSLAAKVQKNIKKMLALCPNLKMLNIGGHLEDLNLNQVSEYLNGVLKTVPLSVQLFLEAGEFWFKNAILLKCTVQNIKKLDKRTIVYFNVSKMAQLRWSRLKAGFADPKGKFFLYCYGCSCAEDDILLQSKTNQMLQVGESVVFNNVSPYSVVFNLSFNGIAQIDLEWIK